MFSSIPDLNMTSALIVYGPMGCMLLWFAIRAEKILEKLVTKVDTRFDDVIVELRVLGHRIHGMSRAMLADIVSRDGSPTAKRIAQEMLEKEDLPTVALKKKLPE